MVSFCSLSLGLTLHLVLEGFTDMSFAKTGAGNYGMCGRAYSPRFLFTWPNSSTGIMGSEQLTAVMETVGKSVDPELKARIEREGKVEFGSARLWVCFEFYLLYGFCDGDWVC